MSFAKIIGDALSEDKYSSGFISQIDDRMNACNDAQLEGMQRYLAPNANKSKFKIWKEGNSQVLGRLEKVLSVRHAIAEQKRKAKDAELQKEFRKKDRKKKKIMEKASTLNIIRKNALAQARSQAALMEKQRQKEEKDSMLWRIPAAERKKQRLWAIAALILVIGIVAAVVLLISFPIYFLIIAVFVVFCASMYILRLSVTTTKVVPVEVTEEQLEEQAQHLALAIIEAAVQVGLFTAVYRNLLLQLTEF